jgi:acetyl esterase
MPIDPDAQRVLDLIREAGRPPYESLPVEEARRLYLAGRAVLQPEPQEVAEVRDLTCPGPGGAEIRLRAYRGVGAPETAPCLVFYHGGGWVIGDLDSHDGPCRAIANAASCRVVSVDYRLAPEHRFPAAFEDSAAAWCFVAREAASRLGVDPARVAVGGDSAGGNLAAAVSLLARDDAATPSPVFQLLIYPAVDLAMTAPSYQRITEGVPLTANTARWFRDHYLATPAEAVDWRASPLRAPSLRGLPPALVLTVGLDPLCDEGIAYARRMDEDGVRVAHLHLADQIHGALTMGKFIRASGLIVDVAAAALRDAWSRV